MNLSCDHSALQYKVLGKVKGNTNRLQCHTCWLEFSITALQWHFTIKCCMRKHLRLQKGRIRLRVGIWTISQCYKSLLACLLYQGPVSTRREQEWHLSRSSLLWLLYFSVPHLGLDTTVPEGTRGCWEKWQLSRLSAQMLPFMTAAR